MNPKWIKIITIKRLLIIVATIALYALFWLITYVWGAPGIRAVIIKNLGPVDSQDIRIPSRLKPLRIQKDNDGEITVFDRDNNQTSYWCEAQAYAPFIVRADYSYVFAPRGGDHISVLYLWFFGISIQIRELERGHS